MAGRKLSINPVTRIEGHGKVTIWLNDDGQATDARLHVTQFRGFEVFTQGRPYEEMPIITQRICGICPVSHQLASAKACDAILGLEIPPTAILLRQLLHMGQYIQSHALHFFYLASPDLLLGFDEDPARRNVLGVIARFPEAATRGLKLRKFGQEIIKCLAGKRVHPAYSVPGGVTDPLTERDRERLLSGFPEAYRACRLGLDLIKGWIAQNRQEVEEFANFPSLYAGLVDESGRLNLYQGQIRLVDAAGQVVDQFDPENYLEHLGEKVETWSYLKFPFYKPMGYPGGLYRVGPLARLNAADGLSTPLAQAEWEEYRRMAEGLTGAILMFHYTRLVEELYALERAEELLKNDRICDTEVKASGVPLNREGVGVIEAPRGILIHHYWVDGHGAMEKANLIVATGHNNLAMNRSILMVAQKYIKNGQVTEGLLNRVEAAIRCFDPCLSCATHALGAMPLLVQVIGRHGEVVRKLCRD